jgi:hypothetical protein
MGPKGRYGAHQSSGSAHVERPCGGCRHSCSLVGTRITPQSPHMLDAACELAEARASYEAGTESWLPTTTALVVPRDAAKRFKQLLSASPWPCVDHRFKTESTADTCALLFLPVPYDNIPRAAIGLLAMHGTTSTQGLCSAAPCS